MKTFEITIKTYWGDEKTIKVAAKTFNDAYKRVPALARKKTYGRYRIISFLETAMLDG